MSLAQNGHTILLGEEDPEVCNYLETALRCQGYAVEVAQNREEVIAYLQNHQSPVSSVVVDVSLPRLDGSEVSREVRRSNRDVPVIMISRTSSPLNMVEAMRSGAGDFISKPINPDDLRKVLKIVIGTRPTVASNVGEHAAAPAKANILLSNSPGMRELQNLIASVGWSEAPVLIQGETGVGKEVFARELHVRSPRAKRSLLKLNCAALPSELVESELFGYERGAFTGAFQKKPGMFELADNGTILLDEIGDMDFKIQSKLLQVLQDQEFQRLGGRDTIKVDVRVIAATHCDLEKAIVENRFREDLYYRLNVINLRVPPLRERREDIIPLADFFVKKYTSPGMSSFEIPVALQLLFLEYHWPGNVRELENIVRKFLVVRDARAIDQELRGKLARRSASSAAPVEIRPPAEMRVETPSIAVNAPKYNSGNNGIHVEPTTKSAGLTPVLVQVANAKREAERTAILAALKATNWNRRLASVQLQTDYKSLLYKMKVLAIKKEKSGISPV
jgi:two-component system response regulator AtoC